MKKKIVVKKNNDTYQIPMNNVVYMEKDLRRIVLHLSGMEQKELVIYGSFRDLIPSLDDRFLCCHRSYIINMDEIVIMSHNQIFLSSNEGIYFGKETYRKALKVFEAYMKKREDKFSKTQ